MRYTPFYLNVLEIIMVEKFSTSNSRINFNLTGFDQDKFYATQQ